MKCAQLIISFLFFISGSFAQVTGSKFAPDHSHWSGKSEYMVGLGQFFNNYTNVYINGDTVINTKYCQKIYFSNAQDFDTTCMQFGIYSYYNSNQLFSDSTFAGNGTLQYDFNLIQGDTFNLLVSNPSGGCNGGHISFYKFPVDSVDSMYYGNKWRKRITFKNPPGFSFGPDPIRWIEGIGDIDHGLSFANWPLGLASFYGFTEYCYCDFGYLRLNCFQEPGYATYGNFCTTGTCSFAVNDLTNDKIISVYPNPAIDKMFIEGTAIAGVSIFDVLGKRLLDTKEKMINVENLVEGIYFVHLKTTEGTLTKKIIIQH